MSNDFSSASERSDIFRGHLTKFTKLSDLSSAVKGRYDEAFEAVSSLPVNERKEHLPQLEALFYDHVKASAKAVGALGELIRAVEQAPDFSVAGVDLGHLREAHADMIENSKAILPHLLK